MRSIHALAFSLAFLTACATTSRPRDRDPGPSSAVAASPAPAAPVAEDSRTYRSALPICFDAALNVCRSRDYRIVSQQPAASISARAPSFDVTFTFTRTPENRTRVVIRRTPDHRDDATRLLDLLCDALLEPRP
jgi:hypothetical protein